MLLELEEEVERVPLRLLPKMVDLLLWEEEVVELRRAMEEVTRVEVEEV